jgi:Flp pilus assembly protein TadG
MISRRRPGTGRSEHGAAALEFALVVLPLLYLVFGIIMFGIMLGFRQGVSQAAAEGARAGAVTPGGVANPDLLIRAQQAINDSLGTYSVKCAATTGVAGSLTHNGSSAGTCKVELSTTCSGSTTGATCVKVTLDYLYRASPLIPNLGLGIVMPDHLRYVSEVQVS